MSAEAVNALRTAIAWQAEIDAGNVNRAAIARREGISRARGTQVMKLLHLGHDQQQAILDGTVTRSIRSCLQRVDADA